MLSVIPEYRPTLLATPRRTGVYGSMRESVNAAVGAVCLDRRAANSASPALIHSSPARFTRLTGIASARSSTRIATRWARYLLHCFAAPLFHSRSRPGSCVHLSWQKCLPRLVRSSANTPRFRHRSFLHFLLVSQRQESRDRMTNPPRKMEKSAMTAVSFDGLARQWVADLERKEAGRLSLPVADARPSLARRLGVPVGTLEGLKRDRTKGVKAWVFERLRAAIITETQREIARCQHELEVALQAGLDPRCDEMAALESAIARAKKLMEAGK